MSVPSTRSLPPGYRAHRLLGIGRSASAWLATHGEWGEVVLKLPRRDAREPLLERMFENEVRITLDLRHRNLIRGFEGVATGPGAFLAIEYCPGGTLARPAEGPLPLARRRRLLVEVASGLEHLHSHGLLHRDVKPANVFIGADGGARLADLGSGIHRGGVGAERVGTAFYMAPELFEGARADFRSDVYSLAVLAFELLSGERPFQGETYDELMLAHRAGIRRSLSHLNPAVGRTEARVVAAALNLDPERRTGSAREFREAYEMALARETAIEQPAPVATGRAARRPLAPDEATGAGGPASPAEPAQPLLRRLLRSLRGGGR